MIPASEAGEFDGEEPTPPLALKRKLRRRRKKGRKAKKSKRRRNQQKKNRKNFIGELIVVYLSSVSGAGNKTFLKVHHTLSRLD